MKLSEPILTIGTTILFICMLPFAVCAGGQQVTVKQEEKTIEGFDWRRFEGETISVIQGRDPGVDYVMQNRLSDFEDLTGIKVIVDDMPFQQANQKKILELREKSNTYDVMYAWIYQEKKLFTKAGWYEPLQGYLNDPMMTSPEYNWADFGAGSHKWATAENGDIYAIPTKFDVWGLLARSSVLKKYGLDMPQTIDELFSSINKVHNPPDLYGAVARGVKGQNALWFSWLFHAYGGSWFDADGKLATYGEPAVDAAIAYGKLMQYAPPGATGFNWGEAHDVFAKGQVAFHESGLGSARAFFDDPKQSIVAGDVLYGLLPGKTGPVRMSTQLGWVLNPYSERKGPGWYFIQWISRKEIMLDVLLNTGNTWTRISIFKDPVYLSSEIYNASWNDAVVNGFMNPSISLLPPINAVGEWRDVFGLIINEAVTNKDREYLARRLRDETERFQAMEESK